MSDLRAIPIILFGPTATVQTGALTTARALAEVSGHWDVVYEAMRRKDASQDRSKG